MPESEAREVVPASSQHIQRAANVILTGGVVAYPTETLYGLAVAALSKEALARLLHVKRRDPTHNISILVSDEAMLRCVVAETSGLARRLMAAHWPGPLTLILPAADGLPAPLVGPGGGVGVRVSSDPVAAELVRRVGRPVTATSANLTSQPPATTAHGATLEGISLVLDGGKRQQQASTVLSLLAEPVVLRQGAVAVDLGGGGHGG